MSRSLHPDVPQGVKDAAEKKILHLVTMNTANGQKPQIFLEELKESYGVEFTTTLISLFKADQKKEWYTNLSPNGQIPLLIDNTTSSPTPIMESSAQMLYLQEKYDTKGLFWFKESTERFQALQWLFMAHGSLYRFQGGLNFFNVFAPEKIPFAIQRFKTETLNIYQRIENHLRGKTTGQPRDYLAGNGKGKYTIAEIGSWTMCNNYKFSGITDAEMEPFPHLRAWIARIAERPAVQKGIGERYVQK